LNKKENERKVLVGLSVGLKPNKRKVQRFLHISLIFKILHFHIWLII